VTAIDTNVLLDVVDGRDDEAREALALLATATPPLVVSPAVYTELCAHRGWEPADVLAFLTQGGIIVNWEMPPSTWSAAGESFARHVERRRNHIEERPRRIATDFIIGAHAAALGILVTLDDRFYRRNFPSMRIITKLQ